MGSHKRHERSRARRMALQVLYTGAMTGESPTEIAESGRYLDEEGEDLPPYGLKLIQGCEAYKAFLTKQLDATAQNWSAARMPVVDQSILRIGAYEMFFVEEVPRSVAINEAVELAKAFGAEDDSPRFVNGVLGKIARSIEAGEVAVPGTEAVLVASAVDAPARDDEPVGAADAPEAVNADGAVDGDALSSVTAADALVNADETDKAFAHEA